MNPAISPTGEQRATDPITSLSEMFVMTPPNHPTGIEHFNGLSPAEAERLAMLAEEAGEIMQAVGKVLRHGYDSIHPDDGPDNRTNLDREVRDLVAVASEMARLGDIGTITARDVAPIWQRKLRYTHHQENARG